MLYSALDAICKKFPLQKAVVCDGESISYSQLWSSSNTTANFLRDSGVQAGDRVCLLSPNSIEAIVSFWAILKCDAISVYLNDQLTPDGLKLILDDATPSLILTTSPLKDKLALDAYNIPILCIDKSFDAPFEAVTRSSDHHAKNNDNIASIIYTSGSTGVPKGVCLTHKNLEYVGRMAATGYNVASTDTYMMVVPLHYIHGLMILMSMHLRGASIELVNSFVFPKVVAKKLQSSKVNGFSGVPFHFAALIDRGGFLDMSFPDLRWMGVTGGTIAPDRLAQLRHAHPEIDIYISYGQTECSPRITLLDPEKIESKPESVGVVDPELHVEFLDEDGKPVADGEIGELVVSGPTVMHGYWNDPVNTARVIDSQGRLHTGDLAMMDADGDVYIKGRLQAMIKTAGERIFPEELEAILNEHPKVLNAAVVGIPDALYGQRVEAHVQLEQPSDAALEDIKAYCLEKVPFARAPRQYYAWEDFPLKANGKTDKQQLVELSSTKAHSNSS